MPDPAASVPEESGPAQVALDEEDASPPADRNAESPLGGQANYWMGWSARGKDAGVNVQNILIDFSCRIFGIAKKRCCLGKAIRDFSWI